MSQAAAEPLLLQGDARFLPLADNSVDLTVTSPFYMDARTYGIGIGLDCEEWIEFMVPVVRELVRVTRGPVIVNCGGVTRDWNYWPGCEGLLYRCWQEGIACRRPAFWRRVGIAGSGGKDWLRADVEYCLCFAREAKRFPHFDVSAIGHIPKYAPGGAMSHRVTNGTRVNQWGQSFDSGATVIDGEKPRSRDRRPSHKVCGGSRRANGKMKKGGYDMPAFANPGNVIEVKVGGGHMGHPLCHENEAPFPEGVPEFFIKGWTKPGDIIFDPFSGSGTTVDVARRLGRRGIGIDTRFSQCELARRRLATPWVKAKSPKSRDKVVVANLAQSDLFGVAASEVA